MRFHQHLQLGGTSTKPIRVTPAVLACFHWPDEGGATPEPGPSFRSPGNKTLQPFEEWAALIGFESQDPSIPPTNYSPKFQNRLNAGRGCDGSNGMLAALHGLSCCQLLPDCQLSHATTMAPGIVISRRLFPLLYSPSAHPSLIRTLVSRTRGSGS